MESVYLSRWNETSCMKSEKDIVFVLMKSMVPAKITAFKVLTLNYETFLKVVKLSFSFYTLLSTVTN
ncbi:unnamed protein product [Acanthoscelides obtectus]|uniref:Uncharacterized protein n=1 Tax=Acanthoscelides obtectus TaxID=200917 RepID=A0A9P0PV55_ACAOB|nr:unnamed protein product [Acanthoscelides obtectus]CAK1642523.1 hypothetical protein AOBTE_LOCUS13093 [Acanthoscelides obtectus]